MLSDDSDEGTFDILLTGGLTPLENWRQRHFETATNTGNAANTADPDQDGLVNLVEYAFGLNPLTPTAMPAVQYGLGTMGYSFTGVPGVIYGAETGTDAMNWTPVADTGTGNAHVFTIPSTGGRGFLRLTVRAG